MRTLALVLALAAGCAPSGQVLLHIDTDAPVPTSDATALDPGRPPWLFDTLRVSGSAAGISTEPSAIRDFAVEEAMFRDGRVSLGIAPPDTPGATVRLELFRSEHAVDGEPLPSATIDATYALPSVGRFETVELWAHLRVDDVGVPRGQTDPLPLERGRPEGSEVGSWAGAQRVSCPGTASAGEVCIPGGAFWIGGSGTLITEAGLVPAKPRLVVLSPFFLDATEVTVRAFRSKWATLGGRYQPSSRHLPPDTTVATTWCTWSEAPAGDEELPINCLPPETMQLYCHAGARELPTEAQLEYVATGLGLQNRYVWGEDEPTCADAIWGRGGAGGIDSGAQGDASCRDSAELGGVAPPGYGARDRRAVRHPGTGATGTVLDLAGNLHELTLDAWSDRDADPWLTPGVVHDPVVVPTGTHDAFVGRGGDWRNSAYALTATVRSLVPYNGVSNTLGFRCARPSAP